MSRRRRHSLLAFCLVALCGAAVPMAPQQMPLSVQEQLPLFLKILSYDKNLQERGDELVLGVLYQRRVRESLLVKEDVVATAKRFRSVSDRPLHVVPLALEDDIDLATAMKRVGIDILYVAPLRAYDVETISGIARAHRMLTLTGVPDYLEAGLSVSLSVKGGRPLIVINLPASEAEGADFHSQLLKVAEVIR